jgi:hypothetical protein
MSLNAIHCWGVLTNNKEKADKVFADFEREHKDKIIRYRKSKYAKEIRLNTGHRLFWVKPNSYARTYRYHKLWADIDLSEEEKNNFVYPQLYCSNQDIIWI